jgi:hypothetical protein
MSIRTVSYRTGAVCCSKGRLGRDRDTGYRVARYRLRHMDMHRDMDMDTDTDRDRGSGGHEP